MKKEIYLSSEIKNKCPLFRGVAITANVTNSSFCDSLWKKITAFTTQLCDTETTESIKMHQTIAATRAAYKACGKQPSRYRPSSEALRRRILRGMDLYQIDTLVDIINLVSLVTGHSIGGFDGDKIQGDTITLGIGREGEDYQAIGRGSLNISKMPVYRDSIGGFGTPTSDHERTKIDLDTTHVLIIINGYDGDMSHLDEAITLTKSLLTDYAQATNFEVWSFGE